MADSNVKLTVKIDGDASGLKKSVEEAQTKIDTTQQTVDKSVDKTREKYDQAGRSVVDMGNHGADAGAKIGESVAKQNRSIGTMISRVVAATMSIFGLGQAAEQAGQKAEQAGKKGSGSLEKIVKVIGGMVIAKGISIIVQGLHDIIIAFRDAYKEANRMAQLRFDINMGVYNERTAQIEKATKALQEYYKLYEKANSQGATEKDKLAERVARRNLERMGVEVDPTAYTPMAKQARQGLDDAQKELIKTLKSKVREAVKAYEVAEQGLTDIQSKQALYLAWGGPAAYQQAMQAQIDLINKRSTEMTDFQKQLREAEQATPGADFSEAQIADALDALAEQEKKHTERLAELDKDYEDAQEDLNRATEDQARLMKDQAHEQRIEAMHEEAEQNQHAMGRFGFQLSDYDEENLDESVQGRLQRRRNMKIDARIEAKRQKLAEGRKVHFTAREQARLDEYRALKGRNKELSAEEKAMNAAKRQEEAAESLNIAAKNIDAAAQRLADIESEQEERKKDIEELKGFKEKVENERQFFADTSVGAMPDIPDYAGILSDIKDVLINQSNKVYVVK